MEENNKVNPEPRQKLSKVDLKNNGEGKFTKQSWTAKMQKLKHKLSFKRTWVQFPSPIRHLTIICNSSSWTSDVFLHGHRAHAWNTGMHKGKTSTHSQSNNMDPNSARRWMMTRTLSQENESINPMRMTVETLMGKTNVKTYQGWRKTLRQLRHVKRKRK